MLGTSLAGLPAFLVYFGVSAAIVVAYLFIYTRITPHDEFGLIRENVSAAAIDDDVSQSNTAPLGIERGPAGPAICSGFLRPVIW